jgi:hypothetical protein
MSHSVNIRASGSISMLLSAMRVTASVEQFVVVRNRGNHVGGKPALLEEIVAGNKRVLLYDRELVCRQPAGFVEDGGGDFLLCRCRGRAPQRSTQADPFLPSRTAVHTPPAAPVNNRQCLKVPSLCLRTVSSQPPSPAWSPESNCRPASTACLTRNDDPSANDLKAPSSKFAPARIKAPPASAAIPVGSGTSA